MSSTFPLCHALDSTSALARLGGNAVGGAAAHRRARPKFATRAPRHSVFRVFLRQFKSLLLYILCVAAALKSGIGHWGDAVVKLAVVLNPPDVDEMKRVRVPRSDRRNWPPFEIVLVNPSSKAESLTFAELTQCLG